MWHQFLWQQLRLRCYFERIQQDGAAAVHARNSCPGVFLRKTGLDASRLLPSATMPSIQSGWDKPGRFLQYTHAVGLVFFMFCKNCFVKTVLWCCCRQDFEERLYVATEWITTKVEGNANSGVIAAHSRLKDYCQKQKDAGRFQSYSILTGNRILVLCCC